MPDCYYNRVECERRYGYTVECAEFRDEGYLRCTETRDNGYTTCARYEDHGQQRCNDWAKNCCDWPPCSWACDALIWICRAWVWIANLICVSWIWVSNIICIAWAWISNIVCVSWRWVINAPGLVYCAAAYWQCIAPEWWQNLWLNIILSIYARVQCLLNFGDTSRNPLQKPGWTLVFQDDFIGSQLDPWSWIDFAYYGARYNPDVSNFYSPTSYGFSTSHIHLLGEKGPVTDPASGQTFDYSVGHIEWLEQLNQRHGYFEIRCRIPNTVEMWPAFWLASRYAWPPEIDIFEFYTNQTDRFESTHHWGIDSASGHPKETRTHRVCKAAEFFHIYACEWSPTEIRWYYDNRLIRVATNGLTDFIHPMHVIVNNAVDTRSGHHPENATYPSSFDVDYVRVYSR